MPNSSRIRSSSRGVSNNSYPRHDSGAQYLVQDPPIQEAYAIPANNIPHSNYSTSNDFSSQNTTSIHQPPIEVDAVPISSSHDGISDIATFMTSHHPSKSMKSSTKRKSSSSSKNKHFNNTRTSSSLQFETIPYPSSINRETFQPDYEALNAQGYQTGLCVELNRNAVDFPLRIWIVDNSGSMMTQDGRRFVENGSDDRLAVVNCTRWVELQETVIYHAELAALLHAPSVFRMLNPNRGGLPQQFSIALESSDTIQSELEYAREIVNKSTPSGTTPLSKHVHQIRNDILNMLTDLKGKRIAVIIATDGLPSNAFGVSGNYEKQEFISALRSLEGLPVWIVIRLCTDDDECVDFYNELDAQLELSIEVLDDFESEAREIVKKNKWLNYTLTLHRSREMGYTHRLFDLLDERKLTRDEVFQFCVLLFGSHELHGAPDVNRDWIGFVKAIEEIVNQKNKSWNSIKKRPAKLLSTRLLTSMYKRGANSGNNCSIM